MKAESVLFTQPFFFSVHWVTASGTWAVYAHADGPCTFQTEDRLI